MGIVVHPSPGAASRRLAGDIAKAIAQTPTLVLGLPTGRTPIPLYRALVARHRAGRLDFRRVTVFNVDELAGLPASHPASYAAFMQRHLFRYLNVTRGRVHLPNGAATDLHDEARRYEAAIDAAGGLDLVLLGIGENGHIAFNEPGT